MVFIDGKGSCYTPCVKQVAFGRHAVRLERAGRAIDRTVQVLEDTLLQVSLVESRVDSLEAPFRARSALTAPDGPAYARSP